MYTDKVVISKELFIKLCAYHLWNLYNEETDNQIFNELHAKLCRTDFLGDCTDEDTLLSVMPAQRSRFRRYPQDTLDEL